MINYLKKLFFPIKKEKTTVVPQVVGAPSYKFSLADMKDGMSMYVTPWAYSMETKQLDLEFTCYPEPTGTYSMPVLKKDGIYIIDMNFEYFGKKYHW